MLWKYVKDQICGNSSNENQSCINEIKSRLNFLLFIYKLLSCILLSKNFKINVYENIILYVILYGCGTWLLTQIQNVCEQGAGENIWF